MSAVAANPMGTVAKDKAYSNLFGVKINGLDSVVDFSNFKTLEMKTAEMKTVSADTINGSSANIALANCNPNELLATDAQTRFVSIPFGTAAQGNSVPKRSSTEFTAFSQLFLTDTSNQIIGNSTPNQVTVNAVVPAAIRIYSFNLESTLPNAEGLTITSSALSNTSFQDPSHTINQIGLKSIGGVTQLNVNSALGFDSSIKFNVNGGPLWTLGNVASDDHFTFTSDLDSQEYIVVTKLGATTGRFTVRGDLTPPSGLVVDLGSPTRRWNSLALTLGAGTFCDTVPFTGVNILPGGVRTITVANPNVTLASCILCQIENFDGVYFTNGCPYALVNNVINATSFDLNVFNLDVTTTIGNTRTVTVRYWVLP